MQDIKPTIIQTIFASMLESISHDTLVKAYAGNCSNVLAEELNDYSSHGINHYVAEFLQEHAASMDATDIECILDNPDHLCAMAAGVFVDGLAQALGNHENVEYVLRHANTYFSPWGNFYIYCEQYSNAGQRFYMIRDSGEGGAYEEMLCRFEKHFEVAEEDATEDTERNDNGVPVNTDNLQLLAIVEFVKPSKQA
jgi:hypothetical protein